MDEANKVRKRIVRLFLENDILVTEDLLEALKKLEDLESAERILADLPKQGLVVLSKDLAALKDKEKLKDIRWDDLDKSLVMREKNQKSQVYSKFMDYLGSEEPRGEPEEQDVKIVQTYDKDPTKRKVQHFVSYYVNRLDQVTRLLSGRKEMQGMTAVSRIQNKKDRGYVSFIGMVSDMQITKNNNIMLTMEDQTGMMKVLVNKNKPELYKEAQSIVHDEVIGILGVNGENIVFANNILWPDVPRGGELKKGPREEYAIFLSDLHVGSNNFLPGEFEKFTRWLRGEAGTENQRRVAKLVKYVFLIGDLVDGVGIYPGQEEELLIPDIKDQYAECARLLSQIPQRISLIICPGNHDAMRIAEPQLPIYKEFSQPIWDLPNAIMVSNPAIVNIGSSESFSGFNVLMYHGYSFDYYVANVDSIRNEGGYDRADLIMKFLLKRRHLAPAHTSTLYIPDPDMDSLVIDTIPDFFVSGHIHKCSVSDYRGVTCISGSCWQAKTSFQEKVGHHPEPCRVPLVNLQTRSVKVLRFG